MSSKARQAKRRANIKKDPEAYQNYLKQDRERKAAKRSAAKNLRSLAEQQEFQLKEKLRVRKYRAKSNQATQPVICTSAPYRSTQAMGKAVKRANTALPSSPRKKLCVVESLAVKVGLQVSPLSSKSTNSHGLSEVTKQLVQAFYVTDDISWQAPGRKDRIIIRESNHEGGKVKRTEQVRYLLMSLKEAFHKFTEVNPNTKIGLSKFCELRPRRVKLFDNIPHNVCVCSYHENIRLLLVALKEHTQLSVDFKSFIDQITCDSSEKTCMSRQCTNCENKLDNYKPMNPTDTVRYQQWQNKEKVEKVDIIGTVNDAFMELKRQLKEFLIHTYVKRKQAAYMTSLISKCSEENVVLQVDFSENATIASQNETQSAHWSHGQATLFTAHAWIKDRSESFVLVSDDLNHTKYSVYVFMEYIMKYLKQIIPSMKAVSVFTDGAGSQFKQKYLFSNLHYWEQDHDVTITWNFFATSHGKGVVDGLGGTVKRSVWRQIRSGQTHITTAEQYAKIAGDRNPNIHVQFVAKSKVDEVKLFLDARWEGVRAVPQTHKMHCFIAKGEIKSWLLTLLMPKSLKLSPYVNRRALQQHQILKKNLMSMPAPLHPILTNLTQRYLKRLRSLVVGSGL